ncbi:hypothetical protein GCM10010885_07420 [Alicyclobacillus cellulosilyticus]|uniref:NlpC/P60 domain-containing protein n=2 Tax=Alicyclobacillus cellulosilyticus TaxID=1003997 RepID=A0A917NHC0_9BACL|nr:hypothetical protein GCM10010885_07420 [Alicyclobacillus cellulosilyticus]
MTALNTRNLVEVASAAYHPSDQSVTLTVRLHGGRTGETILDAGDPAGLVNYATAQFPDKPVRTVRVLGPASVVQRLVPAAGMRMLVPSAPPAGTAGNAMTGMTGWWTSVPGTLTKPVTAPPAVKTPITTPSPGAAPVPPATPPATPAPSTVPPTGPSAASPAAQGGGIPIPPPGVQIDPNIKPLAGVNAPRWAKTAAVLSVARSKLGTPYVWGHNEDRGQFGFDCSNFTEYVYHHALGYKFTTSSRGQAKYVGVSVPRSQMSAGDLLIFDQGRHVGIYVGNNQMIQEGGGLGKVGYLDISPGHYWSQHLTDVKRMY